LFDQILDKEIETLIVVLIGFNI